MVKTSYIFILKNIDAEAIIASHEAVRRKKTLQFTNDIDEVPQTIIPVLTDKTSVDKLLHEDSKSIIFFLDTNKVQIKYWIGMFDFTCNEKGIPIPLPLKTDKCCWNDRHTFTWRPIGCPIRYNPHKKVGIDKDRIIEKLKLAGMPTHSTDFFETEGIFCSFPCCKRYIYENAHHPRYKDSAALLLQLYMMIFDTSIIDIIAAPSWKVLIEYGGHLTIKEYRDSFGKLIYEETVNNKRPLMYSTSIFIAEKKIKTKQTD
jgi:hypothetical protein